jgi:SSS family solute:Na+ symporter
MAWAVALVVSLGAIVGGMLLGMRGRRVDVQEWSVGGRRLGGIVFWFLLAGESFTTFALLGASQAVYTSGAAGYYVLGTVVLTAAMSYWITPRIWHAGKENSLITEGDYFTRRFDAPWLGAVLALFGIVALLLYSQVQLTGLTLMLQTLLPSGSSTSLLVVVAGALVMVFILIGGMRSAAFGAAVKDVLLLVALLIVSFTAAGAAHVDGWSGIFDAVAARYPTAATLPGITGTAATNQWWWMSFLLMTPIGATVLPHVFQVAFSAKDARTIRRNQVIQPFYSLFYVLIVVIALAALLTMPGLKGSAANGALLVFVRAHSPGWLVGLLAGTGILVALVPTGVLILTCSSLLSRNVYGVIRHGATDSEQLRVSRIAVVVLTAVAVLITIFQAKALLDVMVNVYNAISQLAPALILSMLWRRITAIGAITGVVVGSAAVAIAPLGTAVLSPFPAGTVVGLPAMLLNIIVTIAVSLATRPPSEAAIAVAIPAPAPSTNTATEHS